MIACLIGKEWSTSNEQTPGFFPIRLPIPKSPKTSYLWPNGVVSFRKAVSYLHIMYNIHDSHQTIQWYSLQDTPTWYVRRYESFQCTNSPPARTVATGWSFQTLFHQPARQSDCAWSAWGTLSYRTPFRMKNFSPWLRGRTKPARSGSPGFPSWQLLSLLQNLIVTLRFHCTKKKPSGRAGRYFCWLSLPISSHFPWTKFWSNWTSQESVREGPLCQRIDSRFFHTFGLASRVLPWWKKTFHEECSPSLLEVHHFEWPVHHFESPWLASDPGIVTNRTVIGCFFLSFCIPCLNKIIGGSPHLESHAALKRIECLYKFMLLYELWTLS